MSPRYRRVDEHSSGGVVVRPTEGGWEVCLIGVRGAWSLPKGLVEAGESPEETALREIAEETGATGRSLGKLGDVRYQFTWEGERIFKVVSFFLVRYEGGRLGDIPEEFRHEVAEARWLPLAEAPSLLAYNGEREMAAKALERLGDREDV